MNELLIAKVLNKVETLKSYIGEGVKEICHYDDDSILYLVTIDGEFYKIVKTNFFAIEPINESVARDIFFIGVDEEDINEEDFLEFIS